MREATVSQKQNHSDTIQKTPVCERFLLHCLETGCMRADVMWTLSLLIYFWSNMAVHVMVTQVSKLEGKAELWYLKTTSLHPSQHIHTQTHTHTLSQPYSRKHTHSLADPSSPQQEGKWGWVTEVEWGGGCKSNAVRLSRGIKNWILLRSHSKQENNSVGSVASRWYNRW